MPHHILLHPGGLGDLVLAAPLIAGLPGTVTLAIREEFGPLVPLLPVQPSDWVPLPGNPYLVKAASPEWAARATAFENRLRATPADVLIDASFRPTWFSPIAAALAGVPAITAVEAAARYSLPPHQKWELPEPIRMAALDWLDSQGLTPGKYIVCFPGGAAQASVKRWPAARFVELLNAQSLPVLLLGDQAEQNLLAELAPQMPGPGAYFGGRPGDLPLAAALLALASAYCGNDTGPMHLAQAYGVPGVSFFGGGGEWPHYAPWAPGSIGLVHPLPCFGCRWDCCLGHGLCVELIPVAVAQDALQSVLAKPTAPPAVRSLSSLSTESLDILKSASVQYRDAQSDRMARQGVIEELKQAADERLAILIANHEAAAARSLQLDQWERRFAALSPPLVPAVQIATGLGAGNIGDELMAHAFWDALPPAITLRVPLFPESATYRGSYPDRHRLEAVQYEQGEGHLAHWPGLISGGTPVAEAEGLGFPLAFLRTRLLPFHDRGLPVDAVGVGVEPLVSPDARALFQQSFAAVRSWTVRSPLSKTALLDLGVPADRVWVGADWAWLHTPREDKREWARQIWCDGGADPARPIVVVNAVNMKWRHRSTDKLAQALDTVADRTGAQIAFFANDCREGEFFDDAAGHDLGTRMRHPLLRLPRLYFSVDEAIALLSYASLTIGQRYHFLIQSVLAGTLPVAIPRGPKMFELAEELELLSAGTVVELDPQHAASVCERALAERAVRRTRLDVVQQSFRERARTNLRFMRELPPYDTAFARW